MTHKTMKLELGQNRMRLVRLQRQTRKLLRRMEQIRADRKQPLLRAVG